MAALEKLNDLIDESDPDVDMPNIVHAFQTAEEIRAKHPDQEWFHLTGLIHDLGWLFRRLSSKMAMYRMLAGSPALECGTGSHTGL